MQLQSKLFSRIWRGIQPGISSYVHAQIVRIHASNLCWRLRGQLRDTVIVGNANFYSVIVF